MGWGPPRGRAGAEPRRSQLLIFAHHKTPTDSRTPPTISTLLTTHPATTTFTMDAASADLSSPARVSRRFYNWEGGLLAAVLGRSPVGHSCPSSPTTRPPSSSTSDVTTDTILLNIYPASHHA